MKSYRMFEILLVLLNKKNVTSTELAKMFEVSVRTIYRDVDELSLVGVPIYTKVGKNGGIYLDENYIIDKSLITNQDQRDILFALHCLETVPNLGDNELIKKLTALFGKSSDLYNPIWLDVDFTKWHDQSEEESGKINQLKEAILSQKVVQIRYVNHNSEESSRIVDPIKLIYKYKDWYLYAYCKLKQDFRLFKLKRILKCDILHQKSNIYTDIPSPYINNYINWETRTHLILIFTKQVAHKVYENFDHQIINRDLQDYICVSGELEVDDWLYSLLLSFGSNVYVKEPLYVRNELHKRHIEAIRVLENAEYEVY